MSRYFGAAGLLLLVVVAGCARQTSPSPVATAFTATATTPPTQTATPAPIALVLPETVGAGEELVVSVRNDGSTPYAFAIASGDNCLTIEDAGGERIMIQPDLTCDALELHIVQPGQMARYGRWDLTTCVDRACTERIPATAGAYTLLAQFFEVDENGEAVSGGTLNVEESFEVDTDL